MILDDPHGFTEPLEVDDFPFTEEPDRIADFRVLDQPEDVVVGEPCLLLCRDLVKTTAAENLEKALFFVVQAVSCCDFIRTKIEKKEDELTVYRNKQNEEGTVSEEIKEHTYDLKPRGQGRMIQVSIPAVVPPKGFDYNAKIIRMKKGN